MKLKHKLKYHIPTRISQSRNLLKYALVILFILIIIVQSSSGYTLDSSSAQPNKIFKCQPSVISGNFTGTILSAKVWINSSVPVMWNGSFQTNQTENTLTNNGGGYWTTSYGDNASILYGNRTLTFKVTTADGTFYNKTNTWLFIYSDTCTGTGIKNYTQLNSGLGNYTSRLWSNPDYILIDFALQPWIDYWGYFFYLFIIGLAMTSVYQKSQNIWQPLLVAFTGLSALATTTAIPDEFRNWIVALLGIGFGAIVYRLTLGRK